MAKCIYDKYSEEKQQQIASRLGVDRLANMFSKDAYDFWKLIEENQTDSMMDVDNDNNNNKNKNKNPPTIPPLPQTTTTLTSKQLLPETTPLPITPQRTVTNKNNQNEPPSTSKRLRHTGNKTAIEQMSSTNNRKRKNKNNNTVNNESISKGICARPSDTNEQTKKALNKCNLRNRFVFIYIHCNKFIVVYILYGFICKLHGFIIQNIC